MKNINKQEFVNLNSSVSGADSLPGDLSDIINSFDIGEMMDRVADFDLNRECGKMNSIEDGVACLEKGIGHIVDLSAEGIIDQIDIVNQMKDVFGGLGDEFGLGNGKKKASFGSSSKRGSSSRGKRSTKNADIIGQMADAFGDLGGLGSKKGGSKGFDLGGLEGLLKNL
ncbi:Oidioi.mRNA.OKI2018_I69.PAR.g10049.t1.cds [Oikopleura dioica]|uniref:Oidioi.mRNA.OKI2018_I69.PAR.g10049.t1.cds n=1 Tax=Oikopleura dioica TaxID=34765 RepID=A0ABN7RNQ3_OIKDI|nr:Oidioi.mRNA.OKI2018_I69.PAR.g10049.t1.cds [Oikopleura dioica]